jgi:hypothetical protein
MSDGSYVFLNWIYSIRGTSGLWSWVGTGSQVKTPPTPTGGCCSATPFLLTSSGKVHLVLEKNPDPGSNTRDLG